MLKHQHGGDIYSTPYKLDYSANINPLGTPESVVQAACAGAALSANYPDVQCRKLRAAIAEKEKTKPDYIICGNGAAELIFAVAAALRPREALLVVPGFAEYEQALLANDCRIRYYELKEENGFRCQEDYLEMLTDDTDLIFLCNPNNPTGIRMERAQICRILDRCLEKKIRVVLDSCFIDFLDDRKEADFTGILEDYPNLFLLKAFTKTYAMAGLRLGYGLTCDSEMLEKMKEAMQPWSVSIPAQEAGVAALAENSYVEKTRELIREERKRLIEGLEELSLKTYGPAANYIFFKGPEDLAQQLKSRGILIRDCGNYRNLTKGYYRIAVRTKEENTELLGVLKEVLKTV